MPNNGIINIPSNFELTWKFDVESSFYFAAAVALSGILIVAAIRLILR